MLPGRFSASIGLVGIDFGTRAIKMLQVRQQGGRLRIVGAGKVELPAGDMDRGALTDQLRGAFASGGFTGRRCVVSLRREDVCVQSVRLPKMPEEELRQAAHWEAAQRFGFDRNAMQVDVIRTGAVLQGGENREEILLIAVSHDTIDAWVEPLMSAGLRPAAIETHFTALARAFSRQSRPKSAHQSVSAVVDVGASGSTAIILRGDQIAFCKPINIGGRQLNQAVAEQLQMDLDAASELRAARIAAAMGHSGAESASDPSIERAEYDAVRPLLGSFAKEVMLCIRYYGVTFRGHPPGRLVLTGGDALEPRLGETLAHHCKIPVVLDRDVSPIAGLMKDVRNALNRAPGPAATWTVAAGLSLRGISQGKQQRPDSGPARQEAA